MHPTVLSEIRYDRTQSVYLGFASTRFSASPVVVVSRTFLFFPTEAVFSGLLSSFGLLLSLPRSSDLI